MTIKKFADIRKLCSYLGKTLSLNLQKVQALAGYNTISYFYWVEKIKVFKKSHGQQDLGNYSQIANNVIEDTKEFIRATLYNGNEK